MGTDAPTCGLDVALAVVGGKWKPLILYHLQDGPKRFGDLRRLVTGISEKVLIQQLRDLAAVGVLVRRDHQQVPPKVDYTVTPFGMTLVQALMPLCEWGTRNRSQVAIVLGAHSMAKDRDSLNKPPEEAAELEIARKRFQSGP